MSELLSVLIVDDHPAFRDGLRLMLEASGTVEVVGEAANGTEAIEQSEALKPEMVLMDLQMPELNGIEATREIVRVENPPAVIVLTMFEDDDSVFAAMRAGARGYLLKDAERDDILRAVRSVASGDAVFGPPIATRLLELFASVPRTVFPELTDRERELLVLVAAGKSNAAIAENLTLSLKTVRNHVSNIFNKLQVADRAAAIAKAREAGLGAQPPSGDAKAPWLQ
ncbi:MAG: response regulator transcription factor [Thermoleophilaceae bacterium]|nr:response regulator transcription factor [Thermoleophilaceae bacterium]